MKKFIWASVLAATFAIAGCGAASASNPDTAAKPEKNAGHGLAIVSREEGSGTRSAFEELVGINEEAPLASDALIRDGNGTVATFIKTNPEAVGYVSFTTIQEHEHLRALKIDGVEPTIENVLNGTYSLSRPFVLVYDEKTITNADEAFIAFLESEDGMRELEAHGAIVDLKNAKPFDSSAFGNVEGELRLGGSTSTEHSVVAVAQTFTALYPKVTFTYDGTGSGAGIKSAQDGTYSIGFSSRDVLESELNETSRAETFCMDGIAVAVSDSNQINDLSRDRLRDLFTGHIKTWEDLQN